jgi:hypothetical protein
MRKEKWHGRFALASGAVLLQIKLALDVHAAGARVAARVGSHPGAGDGLGAGANRAKNRNRHIGPEHASKAVGGSKLQAVVPQNAHHRHHAKCRVAIFHGSSRRGMCGACRNASVLATLG